MLNWLKHKIENFYNARKYFYHDCTCGEYDKCKLKRYSTSRGGLGIESGWEDCPKIIKQIEDLNRVLHKNM